MKLILIPTPPAIKALIEAHAASDGISVAAWIRRLIYRKIRINPTKAIMRRGPKKGGKHVKD